MGLYSVLVNKFHWSLTEIDRANLETLMGFIYYKDTNPNSKVINGKTYRRTKGIPTWL